jgi:hypothetical protein
VPLAQQLGRGVDLVGVANVEGMEDGVQAFVREPRDGLLSPAPITSGEVDDAFGAELPAKRANQGQSQSLVRAGDECDLRCHALNSARSV